MPSSHLQTRHFATPARLPSSRHIFSLRLGATHLLSPSSPSSLTEVQEIISSPHIATTLIYDVLQRWSQYLNRCVAASASKEVEAPGASVPLSLKSILFKLEGGCYIGPILPVSLADLVSGRQSAGRDAHKIGSVGGGGGGIKKQLTRLDATGDLHDCGRAMTCTCHSCPFRMGKTCGPFWQGGSFPPCTVTVFSRAIIFVGCAGRTANVKTFTSPPPRWQPTSPGYLK